MRDIHIALQFGSIKHFNEGLSEFSRQLALQYARQARQLKEELSWHFHFILHEQWHGMFGSDVQYHALSDTMRIPHRFPVELDIWHGLHQHMRYRPPVNSKRNIITVHDLNHVYAKSGLSLWWQNIRLTRHLRSAHQLIAISQFVANDIQTHLPWAPAAKVVYNGVADLSAAPSEAVPTLQSEDFFLHISRMSLSKNVDALIGLARVWPDAPFVFVGPESPEVDRYRQMSKNMGLTNTRFITNVSEPQKAWLYAHCRGFLFPSVLEGFGLPPIEAMHFGKPVFVARQSCLPEICREHASYWDTFEPESMKQIVNDTMCHWNITRAEKASAHAKSFSWERAASAYIDTAYIDTAYQIQRSPS